MRARYFCELALAALSIASAGLFQPVLAASGKTAAPVIPDLTPWLEKNAKPGTAAWRHAAHFSIPYGIDPGHNSPAPVSTQVDAGYTVDALWLRFLAQDPHPDRIGLRYREYDDISSSFDDFVGVFPTARTHSKNFHGSRLFTANVYDLRVAWYFTPHLFADVIGQGLDARYNATMYPLGAPRRSGTLATQWLIGYQVNPWTVFYAGSSEGYQETPGGQLLPQQGTFFLKGSYYFQPPI